jgi:hypothetical protein
MTLSITTISVIILTISINDTAYRTLSINDNQHNDTQHK